MSYEHILYETDGPVAVVTLNRPELLNAQNEALKEDVDNALQAADEDDDIRVVILKGAGRAFSAGHDMKQLPRDPHRLRRGGPPQVVRGRHREGRRVRVEDSCAFS